ncbi:GAF domain-containing sensor histidine kinase [Flavobacterium frigidarium]|uniref:histidine kinase n=1 Tax=Flavobacterium frigidarium TaxID=99286 RepID=A0ABV4KDS9_9FLAO
MNLENNLFTDTEEKRIKALQSYNILDSLTEQDYDDITLMASIICDVPIALVSFVDKDRQWFKSNLGLETKSTPRSDSFCSHAIEAINEPFIITDSRTDERFKDNPLVVGDPNIVFYAGIPIVTEDGLGLGTVCIIDNKPRELTQKQLVALKMLSNQAMNLLQLRKVNNDLNIAQLALEIQNKKLEVYNKDLEVLIDKNLSDRVKEIAAQNITLATMNKELEAFNYISSHDLQEPLRKIQFFSSIIIDKELHSLSDKGQNYLLRIGKSADRMSMLIKDLLAYSRTTTTEKTFEKILLSKLIQDIKYDLQEEIVEKNAIITLENDLEIKTITFQFRQLLHNILSNSLKFSSTSAAPRIIFQCVLDNGNTFRKPFLDRSKSYYYLKITDNGIGFDNQYKDKIFELFQRLGSQELQMGTGIGLAIVKKIVENHNGFIEAESHENIGTTLHIYIPEVA